MAKKPLYIHNHIMQRTKFTCTHCNTVFFKKSMINREISLYSKARDQIKLRENFNSFKRDFKTFLLKHSFYSVDEFTL
jgi:hypothetical protein